MEGTGDVLLTKLDLLVLSFSRGGAQLVKAELGIWKRLPSRGSFVIKGVPGEDTTSNKMLVGQGTCHGASTQIKPAAELSLGLRASMEIAARTGRSAMDSTGKANRAAAKRRMISGSAEWLMRRTIDPHLRACHGPAQAWAP